MRPTAASVRRLYGGRAPFGGWADFKHRLVRAGVLSSPDEDCPQPWQDAFLRAVGRKPAIKNQ